MDCIRFTDFELHSQLRKTVFWNPSVCMCACVYVYLSVWMERILFIFGIAEFIHHRSASGDSEHLNLNTMGPSNGAQHIKW
jgi:hypothetical protein